MFWYQYPPEECLLFSRCVIGPGRHHEPHAEVLQNLAGLCRLILPDSQPCRLNHLLDVVEELAVKIVLDPGSIQHGSNQRDIDWIEGGEDLLKFTVFGCGFARQYIDELYRTVRATGDAVNVFGPTGWAVHINSRMEVDEGRLLSAHLPGVTVVKRFSERTGAVIRRPK
jgi:hypothetical protein